MFARSLTLPLVAMAMSATSVLAQGCETFGVDYQNGGSYFTNTNSNASFTCVTEFTGCANDTASVMLVNVDTEDQYECSDIEQLPNGANQLSTCPILDNQITSGEWELLILGNNGPQATDAPFAYVRTFSISAGPQQTVTVTPTITYNVTTTPTAFATNTTTDYVTKTVKATKTVIVPASTIFYTVTPATVSTTSFTTVSRTFVHYSHTSTILVSTATAQCTVPARQPFSDPFCNANQWPRDLPIPPGLHIPGLNWPWRRDAAVDAPVDDATVVADRFAKIKARIDEKRAAAAAGLAPRPFAKRAPEASVVTTTVTSPIFNKTITLTAPTSTVYNLTITTDTVKKTLPPTTIHSGVERTTITAPTPTKTITKVRYTSITITKTNTATLHHVTTVTPWAVSTACRKEGGHFGNGWGWN